METKTCTKCGKELPATREHFHSAKRYRLGLTAWCKTCISAYRSDYRQKNLERCLTQERAEVERNREKRYEAARQRRSKDPERHRGYGRSCYVRHADEYNAKNREWRLANPEKTRAKVQRRTAMRIGAPGSHTGADIVAQLARQRGRCYWCGERVEEYHVDHVVPLSRGGSDDPGNLVIACPHCNLSKHNRLPHEWTHRLC